MADPQHGGPSSATPRRGQHAGPGRRRHNWLFALVIPVCAVAPWAVPWPWQQVTEVPTNNPSSIIQRAQAEQDPVPFGGKVDASPSTEAVRTLAKELAASAGEGYDRPVTAKQLALVKTTPGDYQELGRIKIPAIGLDVTFGEGLYAKTLDKGPGHWPGTATPGDVGTSVLSGHRNTHTRPFKELDELKPGDKIVVTMKGKNSVTFRVIDTTIVAEAKYPAFVLKPAKDPRTRGLTLFACHPEGNPVFRIVVRAAEEQAKAR